MVLVYQNGKIFATKKRANTPSMAFLKKKYQNATKIWANGLTSASYWGCWLTGGVRGLAGWI